MISQFLCLESARGLLLMGAAALALLLDNSPLAWLYDGLLEVPMSVRIGALKVDKPLLLSAVRVGVLSGCFACGLLGYIVMRYAPAPGRSSD